MHDLENLCNNASYRIIAKRQVATYADTFRSDKYGNRILEKWLRKFFDKSDEICKMYGVRPGIVQIENDRTQNKPKISLNFIVEIEPSRYDMELGRTKADLLVRKLQFPTKKTFLPGYLMPNSDLKKSTIYVLNSCLRDKSFIDSVVFNLRPYVSATDTWIDDVGISKRYLFYRCGDYFAPRYFSTLVKSTSSIMDYLRSRLLGVEIIFNPSDNKSLNSGLYLNYNFDGVCIAGCIPVADVIKLHVNSTV